MPILPYSLTFGVEFTFAACVLTRILDEQFLDDLFLLLVVALTDVREADAPLLV